jgi:hypothetical protein
MRARTNKPERKYADVARDTLDDIKEVGATNGYKAGNRDRSLGEADRTGRHFDEGTDASKENEAD